MVAIKLTNPNSYIYIYIEMFHFYSYGLRFFNGTPIVFKKFQNLPLLLTNL